MVLRKTMLTSSRISSDSLDISKMQSEDTVLSASITFLSLTDSTHSLQSAPSFPSIPRRPIILNLASGNTLVNRKARANAAISVVTGPRLKGMLMEPITVQRWVEHVKDEPLSDHEPWQDPVEVVSGARKPWAPRGSFFSPEIFRSILRTRRVACSESWTVIIQAATTEQQDLVHQQDEDSTPLASCVGVNDTETPFEGDTVPTIMLSNSTAAVRLSLGSSQHSLARLAPTPLAVRRGRTGPPALPLPALPAQSTDMYPGIPTPFQGSPSAYSPKFEFVGSGGDFTMDLEAMCQDLRSRCPPLNPPSPVTASELHYLCDAPAELDASMGFDQDEWGFARELLETHMELPAPPEIAMATMANDPPATSTPPALDISKLDSDSFSWSTDPTLINSPPAVDQSDADIDLEKADFVKPASELPKQQRRRTVIIETPRNSVSEKGRPARMTVDLSHLADDDFGDTSMDVTATEIPFEPATPGLSSPPTPFCATSTPVNYQRPMSSASMGRPVRSILKTREKKSVRFSELPSMREYACDERELESVFEVDEHNGSEKEMAKTGGRKRAATAPSSNPQSRRKASIVEARPESTDQPRTSFPKHPVVRSFTRSHASVPAEASLTPTSRGNIPARQSVVGRAPDKADIGRPKRLGAVSRSSLPVDSGKVVKKDKKDSSTPSKKVQKKQSVDENKWRKSVSSPGSDKTASTPPSAQRSRMPFRSILTKLRS
ncbi:hypothetical protein BDW22DRAFT_1419936 [Trametopsis cervina]|nr:hypothetical protein BDW22DRAFT_1419936 [Trametopsis cervina]